MKGLPERIDKAREKAISELNTVEMNSANTALILMLNDLMSNPKSLSHERMPSLLNVLCDTQLNELITFIVTLEKAPQHPTPTKGSFNAVTPINSEHAACLKLLNNLSSKFDEHNELWQKANTLLQSSLIIYQDIHLVEINLDDTNEPSEDPEKGKGNCNMM